MTRQIGIFGAAGFGREVAEILQRQLATQRQDARVVFVERDASESVNGLAVVSEAAFLADRTPRDFIVAIADGAILPLGGIIDNSGSMRDKRAKVKKDINLAFGSELIEEKSYKDYQ